jgi:regulator of cell morphogenesis and NO signaling
MTTAQTQNLNPARTVGQWVAADYRLAGVFSRYGIDFCCGGNKPVDQACAEKGVSLDTVLQEAQTVGATPGVVEQYDQWPVDFLADYIVNQFHTYTRQMLDQIGVYAAKVAEAHGAAHPETVTINAMWPRLREAMTAHLRDEEEALFPIIKQLARREAPAGSAQALIAPMGDEHEEVGATLAEFARLSDGYTVPQGGCNTYRAFYGFLSDFEAATKKHIHLENNILFPRTLRLEQELAAAG